MDVWEENKKTGNTCAPPLQIKEGNPANVPLTGATRSEITLEYWHIT